MLGEEQNLVSLQMWKRVYEIVIHTPSHVLTMIKNKWIERSFGGHNPPICLYLSILCVKGNIICFCISQR